MKIHKQKIVYSIYTINMSSHYETIGKWMEYEDDDDYPYFKNLQNVYLSFNENKGKFVLIEESLLQ